jgi:hypothetical protein
MPARLCSFHLPAIQRPLPPMAEKIIDKNAAGTRPGVIPSGRPTSTRPRTRFHNAAESPPRAGRAADMSRRACSDLPPGWILASGRSGRIPSVPLRACGA